LDAERLLAATAELETPVAVVDGDVLERNVRRMAAVAEEAGVALRPHGKTHKSALVARMQLAAGARGLTAATLNEAEMFADAGVEDVLLAHPPVGAAKLRRVDALAERVGMLTISTDSVDVAVSLSDRVHVLWEVDSGHHRIGTAPGQDTADGVAALLERFPVERFRGLFTFPGHVYKAKDDNDLRTIADEEADALLDSAAELKARGIPVQELSIGSTPTSGSVRKRSGVTEMRPGSYVYGDAQQVKLGSTGAEDCALAVVATVVATPAADRAVLDAGSKALSADVLVDGLIGYGLVVGRPDLTLERMGEEHGMLVGQGPTGLRVGDRLAVIPTHCCTTVNLHDATLVVRGDGTEWDPVAARGWRSPGDR
jgi:D-serine deaminase-like pyridoxal phosphate-dependent protein